MTREGVTLAFYEWRPSYPQGTLGGKFESWRESNFFENNQTFVVAQLTSKFQMFVQMNRRTEKPCVYCQVINARLKCKSAFCFCIFQYRPWKPNSPQQHQDPSNRCQKTRTRPKRAHEGTDPKFKKEYRALSGLETVRFSDRFSTQRGDATQLGRKFFELSQKGRRHQQTTNARYFSQGAGPKYATNAWCLHS